MHNTGDILDGRYEVIRVIGRGGMGTVYLCENNRLHNMWAVKEESQDFAGESGLPDEIEILKGLSYPGIPRVVDVFHQDGREYIVEDYIEGENIESIVKRAGKMPADRACKIALELCSIIGYLHGLNPPVIYRDLKPSNVIITPEGKAVLVDFGISRTYKCGREGDTIIMGSKGYAAPEQYGSAQSGKETDIYGLGAVMYFMLTGQIPYSGAPDGISLDDAGLENVIKKAMNPDMKSRYGSIDEMREAIQSAADTFHDTVMMNSNTKGFPETLVLDGTAKRPRNKKGYKKTISILAGVLVFFTLVLGAEYLLWGRSKKADTPAMNVSASAAGDTAGTAETKEEPEKTAPAEDINVPGTIYLNAPISIDSSSGDKEKGKDKHNEAHDIFYKVDPKARAGRFNNMFIVEAEYMEFTGDKAYVYLVVNNTSGQEIDVPLKDIYLSFSDGSSKKSASPGDFKIPDGTQGHEVKIPFQNFKLNSGEVQLHMNASSAGSSSGNDIELTVNVK